jgi:DNA-directed RNA polymerase specialized sigma24 family protein
MHQTTGLSSMTEDDGRLAEVVEAQRSRLSSFIRRGVPDAADAEDILQEVFYELVRANRLLMPIGHLTGWLFQVARNRITDLIRKERPEPLELEELRRALEELPPEQREVFVAHELEGKSFKEIAAESGVNLNTLLSRKRYAVLHLRERLRGIHDAWR